MTTKASASPIALDTQFAHSNVEVVMPEPSADHIRAVDDFVDSWPAIRHQLKRPLFAYYWNTLIGASESGPRIQTEDQVWKYVSVRRITPVVAHGTRYVRILGSCSWEEERGLEIHIRSGSEVIYCGMFEGCPTIEPPSTDAWNFALEENQAEVLAQEFVEDDELEEIAMEASPTSQGERTAALVNRHDAKKKPWWKLW